MQTFRRLAVEVFLVASLGIAPSVPYAQDNEPGKAEYTASCATCHGSDGRGHGEFSQYLTIKPADLTQLSANNDGVFPFLEVFQTVDGRAVVRGHGNPMPIWGDAYLSEIGEAAGPYGAELMLRARIVALVDYVASLQE